MTKRRGIPMIVAVGSAIALGTFLGISRGDDRGPGGRPATGGPLSEPDDVATELSGPVPLGRPYSWGELILSNRGRKVAVIERITVKRGDDGLEILGLYARSAAAMAQSGGTGMEAGFNSKRGDRVTGLAIRPGTNNEYELVIGVRALRDGVHRIDGARIEYHVGSKRYATLLASARLTLCAPETSYPECPP
jgi:hypothetical protein